MWYEKTALAVAGFGGSEEKSQGWRQLLEAGKSQWALFLAFGEEGSLASTLVLAR